MIYIINEIIRFRSEDGAIFMCNADEDAADEPVANISLTMSRLLEHLLERKGLVCPRDDILEKVWDSHGLKTSNNSLNKYITDLRKLFYHLGIEGDFISTVPRIGFVLSESINVRILLDSKLLLKPKVIDNKFNRNKHLLIIASCVLVFISCFALYYKTYILSGKFNDVKVSGFIKIDQCDVNLLKSISVEDSRNVRKPIKKLLDEHKMNCNNTNMIYAWVSDPVNIGYTDRVFISQCNIDSNDKNKFISCKSHYEVDYNGKD